MMTNIIMICIVLFLAGTLLGGAEYQEDGNCFFNKENSNALRGFWCLIVILVHIPLMYQNKIQDMLGSFAYIGVTFFFMTSAFGLRLQVNQYLEHMSTFWARRLPKLLIPCVVINLFELLLRGLGGEKVNPWTIVRINDWVLWLIACYAIFWIAYKFIGRGQDFFASILIIGLSVIVYVLKPYINRTTWCPEVIGFVWGILLFNKKKFFEEYMHRHWLRKVFVLCGTAGWIGICYLKFKTIVFWGDYMLKVLLGFLIILFMLSLNTHINIGNRVNLFLGNISFDVYLSHGIVFEVLKKVAPQLNSGMFILLSILATVLFSAIMHGVSAVILSYGRRVIHKCLSH